VKDVVRLAELPEIGAVPRLVVPFRNVRVPVGEFPCTVAVSVTFCCSSTLVADALSVVVVATGAFTVRDAKPVAGP
jgi:hypothetical protein